MKSIDLFEFSKCLRYFQWRWMPNTNRIDPEKKRSQFIIMRTKRFSLEKKLDFWRVSLRWNFSNRIRQQKRAVVQQIFHCVKDQLELCSSNIRSDRIDGIHRLSDEKRKMKLKFVASSNRVEPTVQIREFCDAVNGRSFFICVEFVDEIQILSKVFKSFQLF